MFDLSNLSLVDAIKFALISIPVVALLIFAFIRYADPKPSGKGHGKHEHKVKFAGDHMAQQLFGVALGAVILNWIFSMLHSCSPYAWDRFLHTWGFYLGLACYGATFVFNQPRSWIGTFCTIATMCLGILCLMYWLQGYGIIPPLWDLPVIHQLFPDTYASISVPATGHWECSGPVTHHPYVVPPQQ